MDIDHDHFHAMPRRRPVWDGPNAPQGHTLTDPSPAVAVGNDSAGNEFTLSFFLLDIVTHISSRYCHGRE